MYLSRIICLNSWLLLRQLRWTTSHRPNPKSLWCVCTLWNFCLSEIQTHTFLAVNLLMEAFFAIWIGWEFPKSPSPSSLTVCLTVLLLIYLLLVFYCKQQEETRFYLQNFSWKPVQLNLQIHHFQVLFATQFQVTIQLTFLSWYNKDFLSPHLPKAGSSFPSEPFLEDL